MEDKIKVYNNTKHSVGVYLLDTPNVGRNILPGTFCYMTADDIDYLMASTTLFSSGELRPEEKGNEILLNGGIDVNTNPNYADDDDIRKKLAQSAKKIEEWLGEINEGHVLEKVYDIAMEMNLPAAKLKVLQAKMPDREFI